MIVYLSCCGLSLRKSCSGFLCCITPSMTLNDLNTRCVSSWLRWRKQSDKTVLKNLKNNYLNRKWWVLPCTAEGSGTFHSFHHTFINKKNKIFTLYWAAHFELKFKSMAHILNKTDRHWLQPTRHALWFFKHKLKRNETAWVVDGKKKNSFYLFFQFFACPKHIL